ncbi:MAG: hypothetical protein GY696_22530 [Gammaproteobacteria bacterium]|nr:hypothetical protein [Gammaproteobacteria bacterium]
MSESSLEVKEFTLQLETTSLRSTDDGIMSVSPEDVKFAELFKSTVCGLRSWKSQTDQEF